MLVSVTYSLPDLEQALRARVDELSYSDDTFDALYGALGEAHLLPLIELFNEEIEELETDVRDFLAVYLSQTTCFLKHVIAQYAEADNWEDIVDEIVEYVAGELLEGLGLDEVA